MTKLDVAYREQLEAELARPRAPWHVVPWQTRAMLAWMETHAGGRLAADDVARAWVWSDLHLDHRDIVWHFSRPFRTVDGMRRALIEAWRQTVGESDLVICAGDVTVGSPNPAIDEEPPWRGAAAESALSGWRALFRRLRDLWRVLERFWTLSVPTSSPTPSSRRDKSIRSSI